MTPTRYVNEIFQAFEYLPAWPLGTQLDLGDVGIYQNRLFERERNLAGLGVNVEPREDAAGNWGFASEEANVKATGVGGGVEVGALDTTIANAGAAVELSFDGAQAVFLRAEGVTIRSIENLGEVKDAVLALEATGQWERRWAVVTHLIEAEGCLVLISQGAGAKAEFSVEAGVPLAPAQMAKGNAGISLASHSNMAYDFSIDESNTPLFKAQRVVRGLRGKRLKQVGKRGRLRPPAAEPPAGRAREEEEIAEWVPIEPDE